MQPKEVALAGNFPPVSTPRVRLSLLVFFISLLAGPIAQAADPWDRFIEAMQNQQIISAEKAKQLRDELEQDARPFDVDWSAKIQIQAAWTQASTDQEIGELSTLELRRLRWGFKAKLSENMDAEAEAQLVPGSSSVKKALLSWQPADIFRMRVGVTKPFSSIDENTSSTKLKTIEKSHVSNTVADPGESTGLYVEGKEQRFYYVLGVFTDQAGTNPAGERAYYLHNARLGATWKMSEESSLRVEASFMHSDDREGLLGQSFEQTHVGGIVFAHKGIQLQAEALKGIMGSQKTQGWYVLPSYSWGKYQAVLRVESFESDASNLSLPGRYSGDVNILSSTDVGNRYKSVYLGLVYQINGDDNKVLLGLERSDLEGTPGGAIAATSAFMAWRVAL